jgi:hypothetical protein
MVKVRRQMQEVGETTIMQAEAEEEMVVKVE